MRILLVSLISALALSSLAHPASARVGSSGAASTGRSCLPTVLRQALEDIENKFGTVEVISTHRPGAVIAGTGRRSKHADCRAADFNPPPGKHREVLAWLNQNHKGGIGTYSCGMHHIHIDNGDARHWHKCVGGTRTVSNRSSSTKSRSASTRKYGTKSKSASSRTYGSKSRSASIRKSVSKSKSASSRSYGSKSKSASTRTYGTKYRSASSRKYVSKYSSVSARKYNSKSRAVSGRKYRSTVASSPRHASKSKAVSTRKHSSKYAGRQSANGRRG
jgi:hypothetical protein